MAQWIQTITARVFPMCSGGKYCKSLCTKGKVRAAFENTMQGFDERGQQIHNCNFKMHQFIISLVRKGVFPPLEKKVFFFSQALLGLCIPHSSFLIKFIL